jgi:hypothetical protein
MVLFVLFHVSQRCFDRSLEVRIVFLFHVGWSGCGLGRFWGIASLRYESRSASALGLIEAHL